ncbi:MAG: VWA domain-containing protein [Hamadaea sp.]|nr:VWA domain-containing protein [Hamadaea sp.]
MRRYLVPAVTVVAAVLALPGSASADPRLTVSSLRQEAGFVEFYLSGQDLPDGGLSQQTIKVTANDRTLPVSAQQLSSSGGRAQRRAVVLVLDTSGSMKGAPLDAAKAAATAYVDALPSDVQVAVVTAGAPTNTPLTPTADRARTKTVIGNLTATGETALYDGVRAAVDLVRKDYNGMRVLLLSDGADTASKATFEQAKQAAAGIPVDTIAYKTEETTASVLAGLSSATGGKTYSAGDPTALRSAFSQAAGSFSAQLLVRVTVPKELEGKEAKLLIQAVLGTTTVATDVTVTFVPDVQGATPLIGELSSGFPMWLEWTLVALVFVGLLALGFLVIGPMLNSSDRRRRAAQVEQFTVAPRRHAPPPESENPVAQAALQMSEQVMKQANVEGRLAQQLDRAGMRMRPHEWLLLRMVVSVVGALVLAVLISPWYVGFILGALIGAAATTLYHRLKAERRVSAFATTLPDALQLVIGSLRSGFSLTQSVDAMTKELGDPIATEFGRALGETRLGVDIEDALERVATRMRSKDLGFVVVAIRVQREIGGNLAEVLTTTVNTMRERMMLHRHVRALSAEGRLSAYVLIALPIVVLGYMALVRGEYLVPLVSTPIGWLLSLVGVVQLVLGTLWMLKVVKVEV